MDVIVVGSGSAGIAALRNLNLAGLKTICLEAAERIGGRVNTMLFGDGVVDLGAAFCEGTKENIAYGLAKDFDLLEGTLSELILTMTLEELKPFAETSILSNGQTLSNDKLNKFVKKMKTFTDKYDKNEDATINSILEKLIKLDQDLQVDPLTPSLLEWYKRYFELAGEKFPDFGKSLKGSEERKICEGSMLVWKKGFGVIIDLLMNRYPDSTKEIPMDVRLKKDVDKIHWRTANKMVQVSCKDGSIFEAKTVLVTISVGVLKERHSIMFDPTLPEDKILSINSLQMFVLDKIFIKFISPWWPTSPAKYNVIWRQDDKFQFSEEEKWLTYVYGFETVVNQPNVLVGWINDQGALLMEKTNEDVIKKGIMKLLKVLFGDVVEIECILRTKWNTNRFERGCYSYRSGHTEKSGGSAKDLGLPIIVDGAPVLCFAGEATHECFSGSVHGAIETGFREADRLIRYFNK